MEETGTGILDRRYRSLTVGAVLTVSIVAFEALALSTIAPTMARDLDGVGLYAWIFSAFLLAQIVGGVAAGQQIDRFGTARPFQVSLILFGAGLFAGALSTNMIALICARALQGAGGGALVTCVYATINTAYPDELRTRMLAAFSSAFVLPALIGPAIAGFVADQLTWRAIFFGFLPFLLVVSLLTAPAFGRLVPAGDENADEVPADNRLPGAGALAAGTGLLLAGLNVATDESVSVSGLEMTPAVAGSLLVVPGALVALLALRKVLPEGTLTARRGLPATVVAKGMLAASYFYTETYMVLALNEVAGYSATNAGLVVSAGALSWTAGTWLQERLDGQSEGKGRRGRFFFGTVLLAVGISGLAVVVVVTGDLTLAVALAGWVLSGLGMGLANTAGLAIAFSHAPAGEEGAVSSSVLLSDLFFPATAIGIGGALVAFGAMQDGMRLGVALAFGLVFLLTALLLVTSYRLPGESLAGRSGVQ